MKLWTKLTATAFALVIVTNASQAAVKQFQLERGNIKLDVPSQWQIAPELYGIPLMVLGPMGSGPQARRPVITVIPTGIQNIKFELAKIQEEEKSYRTGREKWLKKFDGAAKEFFPYKKLDWTGVTEAHRMGFRYVLGSTEFVENTYYVVCDKSRSLYHIKTLVSAAQEKEFAPVMDATVRSFSCN
jgi:hypothetical protein